MLGGFVCVLSRISIINIGMFYTCDIRTKPSQQISAFETIDWTRCALPHPRTELMPGLEWGEVDVIGTPAFWAYSAALHRDSARYRPLPIGCSLHEEIAACMLCGHGIKSEVGMAYFDRLRSLGFLNRPPSAAQFETVLRKPACVNGREVRYRFPRSKAVQIASALEQLDERYFESLDDIGLRNKLMTLPGVGPKTASFIVRNYRASDNVAILDVHLVRCLKYAGLFASNDSTARSYFSMEQKFIDFARAIGARPSHLDAVIWDYGRSLLSLFR